MQFRLVLALVVGVLLLVSCESETPKSKNSVEIIKGQRTASKRVKPQGYKDFGDEGIYIKMEREGNGEQIQMGDVVTFHYKEWLLPKRRKINDSYERLAPKSIRLGDNQVIKGLEQVLIKQKVGAVFQVQIPWQLAYGENVVFDYPPKSEVVMDVTVLGTKKAVPFNDTTGIAPIVLNSGIKVYKVSEGTGVKAKAGNGVEVHYHGYFADGRIFDSSYDRNNPIRLQLGSNQVIAGWEEVLSTLHVGDKVTAYIPYYMAYGENGSAKIPPKTDLYFDMELVAVKNLE